MQIMGILNITPDSFSDGGKYLEQKDALEHAEKLINQGAEIIDIGGESSRPDSEKVSPAEELKRISYVVKELSPQHTLSIDTYKASTAKKCLELGAKIINDITALRADEDMAQIVKEHNSDIVLMFSKKKEPHADLEKKEYKDLISEIITFLSNRIEFALSNGIKKEKIILDPGMGAFISPMHEYSWQVISEFEKFKNDFSEFRTLIGTSRKGFVKKSDALSAFTACYSKADIIRTHNPEMTLEFHKAFSHLNH